jgi:hypothetical protein
MRLLCLRFPVSDSCNTSRSLQLCSRTSSESFPLRRRTTNPKASLRCYNGFRKVMSVDLNDTVTEAEFPSTWDTYELQTNDVWLMDCIYTVLF